MADEKRIAEILTSAREHGGRFLLPRRYGRPLCDEWKTETDHDWDACQALVNRGEAVWILNSSMSPCIELRDKWRK